MPPDFEPRLLALAEVILRVGVNLQPGQRLLIGEPYELQGVARSAGRLVEAIRTAAREMWPGRPAPAIEVIWGDAARLREFAVKRTWHDYAMMVGTGAAQIDAYIRRGDAVLFLQSSLPGFLDDLPVDRVSELRRIGWEYFGPVSHQLVEGATNWSVAPAPTPEWALVVNDDLPAGQRLGVLWDDVFKAMRIPAPAGPGADRPALKAIADWEAHLGALARYRDTLNLRLYSTVHYEGDGTHLTVALPEEHLWCTAQLKTKSGLAFTANLPTEEVFTVPHRDSAEGIVRAARPVCYGSTIIDGIELEFKHGRVVQARAREGEDLLKRLLETDEGARRLGEVAILPAAQTGRAPDRMQPDVSAAAGNSLDPWQSSGRFYYHPLLDENTGSHIALGESYGFCLRAPNPAALNRSLIHVDLSIEAKAHLGR